MATQAKNAQKGKEVKNVSKTETQSITKADVAQVPAGVVAQANGTPAPAAPEKAKIPAKMEQVLSEDGDTIVFKFRADPEPLEPITVKVSEFPENVRSFFAYFGARTKLRNFTVPDAGEDEASPTKMREKLAKGVALLKAGTLRIVREAGEKGATTTLILEAAMFYKRRKAALKGEEFTGSEVDVAKELEALPPDQVEQLKATTLFQLALQDAKDARAAVKRKALEEKAAKEAASAPM